MYVRADFVLLIRVHKNISFCTWTCLPYLRENLPGNMACSLKTVRVVRSDIVLYGTRITLHIKPAYNIIVDLRITISSAACLFNYDLLRPCHASCCQSQTSHWRRPCGIYGGQYGTGVGFSPKKKLFHCRLPFYLMFILVYQQEQ